MAAVLDGDFVMVTRKPSISRSLYWVSVDVLPYRNL